MPGLKPLNIENADIGFRNFSGKEGPYNRAGEKTFAVFLDHELAENLARDGWNVKFPKDNGNKVDPDEDTRRPYLTVAVGFEHFPANVFLVSNGVPTKIFEDEVNMLDWAEIESVDLVIRPYEWTVSGKSGIKAYLKAGYFNIVTDAFAEKYGV